MVSTISLVGFATICVLVFALLRLRLQEERRWRRFRIGVFVERNHFGEDQDAPADEQPTEDLGPPL